MNSGTQIEAASPSRTPKGRPESHGLRWVFVVIVVIVLAVIGAGLLPRLHRQEALLASSQADNQKLPVVLVTKVQAGPGEADVELPGDLQALIESPIYARADGYLSKRNVDIGDRVKAGDVLAEIETPELEQQIQQARATLAQAQASTKQLEAAIVQARANLNLAQVTADRWKKLADKGAVARQDTDEKQAAWEVRQAELTAAEANLNAARSLVTANEANLKRLEELKSFDKVTAPFSGIVTVRNVDVGTLVNSGNGGPAREMFRLAQLHVLRIFVNVPQTYAAEVHAGQSANLTVDELPGQVFPAVVDRISQSLDERSRTMLAILNVPNPREILLPGMYTHIRITLPRPVRTILIPGDALVVRSDGTQVAVVDSNHRVHFRRVVLGRDFGQQIEVRQGLAEGDLVVANPTDDVRENAAVELRLRK